MKTRSITYISLCTALIAVTAQLSIPMPLGVPMTLQTFAITLSAIVLGSKCATYSTIIYVALGAVGVPVFANFTGGITRLFSATGGFILSFPIMAFLIGLGVEIKEKFKGAFWIFLIFGTTINYIIGLLMFCLLTGSTLKAGMSACVVPFIPTTIIKALLATVIGFKLRRILIKNKML